VDACRDLGKGTPIFVIDAGLSTDVSCRAGSLGTERTRVVVMDTVPICSLVSVSTGLRDRMSNLPGPMAALPSNMRLH
jgi:hypothetical protein